MSERKSNIAFGIALLAIGLNFIMTITTVEPVVIVVFSTILLVLGAFLIFHAILRR
jgi:hypothetical protein